MRVLKQVGTAPLTGTLMRWAVSLLLAVVGSSQALGSSSAPARDVDVSGVVETWTEDYADHARVRNFLRSEHGRWELRTDGGHAALPPGSHIRVRGTTEDGSTLYYLASDPASVTSSGTSTSTAASVLPNTMGEQRVAVILVNFRNDASEPMSTAEADNLVFGEVGNFYWENSYAQTWLTGTTYGWYTLPMDNTGCPTADILSAAKAEATANGVDFSTFDRVVYFIPQTAECGWAGSGGPGDPPVAIINGPRDYTTVAHELGHSFGLLHSQGLDCDRTALGDTCTEYSYGDAADVMGNGGGHFNAYQKERLGWIADGATQAITTVTASGTYHLAPYADQAAGTKALRIARGIDPATGYQTWYYLEYRQPVGFDASIVDPTYNNYVDGITVHSGAPEDLFNIFQLDMTPNSRTDYGFLDLRDGALEPGQSYADAAAGVSVTLDTADSSGATVRIDIGGGGGGTAPCTEADPSVGLTGPAQSSAPGATASFQMTVQNNDTDSCSASDFALSATLPQGWTGAFESASVNVAPGATATVLLYVTSTSSTTDGTYPITSTAANASVSDFSASAAASLQIATSTTGPKGGGKGGGGSTTKGGGKGDKK